MLQEDKQILWRVSAVLLGAALPAMLLGKTVLYVLVVLGMFSGLMATKDESLRITMKMLLNSRVTVGALVLMGCLLVGVAVGIEPKYALHQWFEAALFGLGAAVMFVTFREMPGRHLETLLKILAVGTMVVCGLSMVDALAHDPRFSAALHGTDMATTPYRLNYMSGVLAVILPFVWARLLVKSREGEPFAVRIAPWAAGFGFVTVLVCGGRSGWVGMVAGLLVFLLMASRYHGVVIHKKHWGLGLLLVALGVGLYAFAAGTEFVADRVTIVGEMGQGRGMLSGRGEVWAEAWRGFLAHPVFGVGVMNFRNLPGAVDLHPHSWLLQLLLEGGVVSTVVFVALMGMVAYRFYGFAKGNMYGVAALASLTAYLVTGLANTSIFNGWWLTFLIFACTLGWRAGWGGGDLKKRRRAAKVIRSAAGPDVGL